MISAKKQFNMTIHKEYICYIYAFQWNVYKNFII